MSNRDDISITISGVHGAQNYNLSKLIRLAIKILVGLALVILLFGISWIFLLQNELSNIENQRDQAEKDFLLVQKDLNNAKKQRSELQLIINQERARLEELGNNLGKIEDLIGLNQETDEELSLEHRMGAAEQSSFERSIMLTSIPSGNPIPKHKKISSSYGWRIHPVVGSRQFHKGIDYSAKIGTPVYATADGIVEYAGRHKSGFGKMVIINHQYGFRTLFAHLNTIKVKMKKVVRKGQVIALSGNSGVSTGPHLHYEVSFNRKNLDPKYFIQWDLENYESIFKKVKYIPWESLISLVNHRHQPEIKPSSALEATLLEN